MNSVDGGQIVCPCHGSRFDLGGNVVTGPAESGLGSVPVSVRGTDLTLD